MTSKGLTIACVGWGSLCWRPGELRTSGGWRSDGPLLPLEFARASDDGKGRLTLVITPGVQAVRSLWTLLDYATLDDARNALSKREGCSLAAIGAWPGLDERRRTGGEAIGEWARAMGLNHVLWTALGPKFRNEKGRQPTSAQEAVDYLLSRPPDVLAFAEEYVRRAPPQIQTAFRRAFVEQLGWSECGAWPAIERP